MKILLRYTVLVVLLCVLAFSHSVGAQNRVSQQDTEAKDTVERLPFLHFKRFAIKTNAFDWLAVVPNIGVEYQITDDPYKYMTVGLSAKCNWNSYHGTATMARYQPSFVYDILDIRPEFRYYYRAIPKPKSRIDAAHEARQKAKDNLTSLRKKMQEVTDPGRLNMYKEWVANAERELALRDSILKASRRPFGEWLKDDILTFEREEPRMWRAHYIGAYASYANYAFKFGAKGIRARNTFGFGATAGYVLPLYEYAKGVIDIDLGFSVGIQMAKHEVFTHNMDGNYYTKLQEGRNWYGMGGSSSKLLPYPVVSELRVAFVWRKQSIKFEAKMDEATIKKKREFERVDKVLRGELEKVMPLNYKTVFDESNKESLRKWKQNDTLYRAKFAEAVASQKEDMLKQVEGMTGAWEDKQVIKLRAEVDKREAEMLKVFDRLRAEEIRAARSASQPDPKSKDASAKEKATKEKVTKTQNADPKAEVKSVKEKSAKEKPVKEEPAKEKAAKEKQVKEEPKPAKDPKAESKSAKEKPAKEKTVKEEPAKEKAAKEKQVKAEPKPAKAPKEEPKPAKEKPAKEKPAKEKSAK